MGWCKAGIVEGNEVHNTKLIILYMDVVGRRNNMTLDTTNDAVVQQLVQQCTRKLPADAENPAKEEIEQEISELEYRLAQLRKSIGVT